MSTTRSIALKAPATEPAQAGLLLCAHGVYGGLGSAARHVAEIARRRCFAEVRVCCLKGRPGLADVVQRMQAVDIYLVPMLMAEGYTATRLLPRALAELPANGKRIVPCRALGANPRLADLMAAAARRTCRQRDWHTGETTFIIMGHGTPRCATSGDTAAIHAARIARQGEFAEVLVAYLDQAPGLAQTLRRATGHRCVVTGLFADRGSHGETDVPRLLSGLGKVAAYAGPIGTLPEIADLVLDQVEAARSTRS